jgi:thioredoxin reductase (NADPH)
VLSVSLRFKVMSSFRRTLNQRFNPVSVRSRVVGGGNGAGQAALFLASCRCEVTLAIRRPDIESGMSRYLVDRVLAHPNVTVRGGAEVRGLNGEEALESISGGP